MSTITDIYKKYPVHKGLQEHMIRVAAVAKVVTDHLSDIDTKNEIIASALLHDMGNLLKSKPGTYSDGFEPEGPEYWQAQKEQMAETYGASVHDATIAIVHEATSNQLVREIIDEASFEDLEQVAKTGRLESKVLEYADMRVAINGIVSLEERFQDIADRYIPHRWTQEKLDAKLIAAKEIEQELFSDKALEPEHITDESTSEIQKELWQFEIS